MSAEIKEGQGMMVVAVSGNNNVVGCGCGGGGNGGGGSGGNGSDGKVGDEQFNATCKDGKVVLTWKAGDAFKLFRDGQLLKEGTTETTYTDTVTDDKDYIYKLEQGTTSKSLTVNPKTLCQASENPNDQKLNLKAVCDNNKVKLTWDELTGSDGKKAHYNVSPGQNDLIVNYYVTDLTAGLEKPFTVSAFDSSNKPLASESLNVVYDDVCVRPFEPPADCSDRSKIITERVNGDGFEYITGSPDQPAVITKTDTVTLEHDCLAVCSVNTWSNPFYHNDPSTHGCYQEPPSEIRDLLSVTIKSVVIDSNNKKQVTITWSASRAGRAHPNTPRCEKLVQVSYIRATTP